MTATFSVWYMKPSWFRDGIMGEKPDPMNLDATHVHLRDIELETSIRPSRDLERVWCRCQGEAWSPNGEGRALIESKGLGHTSMSVGDVIVVDGLAYIAEMVGFNVLGPTTRSDPRSLEWNGDWVD